jgi:hypothetical protein
MVMVEVGVIIIKQRERHNGWITLCLILYSLVVSLRRRKLWDNSFM